MWWSIVIRIEYKGGRAVAEARRKQNNTTTTLNVRLSLPHLTFCLIQVLSCSIHLSIQTIEEFSALLDEVRSNEQRSRPPDACFGTRWWRYRCSLDVAVDVSLMWRMHCNGIVYCTSRYETEKNNSFSNQTYFGISTIVYGVKSKGEILVEDYMVDFRVSRSFPVLQTYAAFSRKYQAVWRIFLD